MLPVDYNIFEFSGWFMNLESSASYTAIFPVIHSWVVSLESFYYVHTRKCLFFSLNFQLFIETEAFL